MKRIALITALAAGWIFTANVPNTTAAAESGKTNVLFIISDDLNCDLHCYGHEQVRSPNIDRLAKRGVRFERAYCQFPLCSPSRTSMLTGRRPDATRILTNSRPGPLSNDYTGTPHFRENIPDTVTLPQLFRQHGYTAARIGKLYHYGVPTQIGTSGLDDPASWDFVVNPSGRDKAEENKVFSLTPGRYGGSLSWLASEGTDAEQTDGLIATSAISLLEQYKSEATPFFLAVGFFRPHTPYVAPKNYFESYPTDGIALPKLSADDQSRVPPAAYASAKKEQEKMDDPLRREAIQAYWASIEFMDAQVGRVLDALDRLELDDNTIVVFTSDHGYHMYDHGLWQKQSLFENSARVPLIVAAPGAKGRGKATESLAELVDLYPTLADLCGLPAPDYLDGNSQRPVLDDPRTAVKDAAFTQVRRGQSHGYSIRTPRWRYMLWADGDDGEQLFDMQADPSEAKNLVDDARYASTVAELKQRVLAYAKAGK
ncbi:MAG: sulfatase [Planctomycetales bacterium]|nr:sulfatase [Planctomycetales bacterium]